MKKLIVLLLSLIMTVCIINMNNIHTIAEENADYNYSWNGTNWNSTPETSYNQDDVIRVNKNQGTTATLVVNGKSKSYSWPYTIKVTGAKIELTTDGEGNGLIKIVDRDFTKPITCEGLTFENGYWKEASYTVLDPTYFGISMSGNTATLSESLNISIPQILFNIKSSLNFVLSKNISLIGDDSATAELIVGNANFSIDGNGNTLTAKSNKKSVVKAISNDLSLNNINLVIESTVNNDGAFIVNNLNLGDRCTIEITQKDVNGYALYTGTELSNDINDKYEILGKADPNSEALKTVTYNNTTHIYEVQDDDTDALVNARYIVISPKKQPKPDPSPSKKDESCEKVIGPTWHWNNDKGICEEYATVGTSTR